MITSDGTTIAAYDQGDMVKLVLQNRSIGLAVNLTDPERDELIAMLLSVATDFYSILGVDRRASQEDIKTTYRTLAKANHPDMHPGDQDKTAAEERQKSINAAYETLSDPAKRKAYDNRGSSAA
jgi:DnaJ-domain-containing protein 1